MVKAFHEAGIEVILDVVYNHTAEAGPLGRRSRSAASTTRLYHRVAPETDGLPASRLQTPTGT